MEEPLTKQQQKLVEENHNLIYSFANKKNLNIDEYYDILAIELCRAAKIFDENKGNFSTVAYSCMMNELYNRWKYLKTKRVVPSDMIVSYDASRTREDFVDLGNYLDVFSDNNSTEDIVESNIMKIEFLNLLDETDQIVFGYIINGATYDYISKKLGCTRSRIGQRVQRIRKQCADYLNKYN